jgi:hypothetical protein
MVLRVQEIMDQYYLLNYLCPLCVYGRVERQAFIRSLRHKQGICSRFIVAYYGRKVKLSL